MRIGFLVALLVVALTTAACDEQATPEPSAVPEEVASASPAYDGSLEPAAAVMALVPADATLLEVTDFAQIRLQVGLGVLTSESPQRVRDKFWRRAERLAPLLNTGMFRDDEERTARRYGFTQDDVEWEAHFSGPSGDGYVVRFRDDLPMGGVKEAASDGRGPLSGAVVVLAQHLAAFGATGDPDVSWAADPALTVLTGSAASATHVERACLPFETAFGIDAEADLSALPADDLAALEDLGPFSVTFGGQLATVRLGPERGDVFKRARLADHLPATDPEFGLGYADAVADPRGGRIGYTLADPQTAVQLAREHLLPFAVCGQA